MSNPDTDPKIQGEGDYEAGRRYDEAAKSFAKSGKVEQAARDAKPKTVEEGESLKQAEERGKSHAKGEDPAVKR